MNPLFQIPNSSPVFLQSQSLTTALMSDKIVILISRRFYEIFSERLLCNLRIVRIISRISFRIPLTELKIFRIFENFDSDFYISFFCIWWISILQTIFDGVISQITNSQSFLDYHNQTKFLYLAKLVFRVTRLQMPACLVIPINQVTSWLSHVLIRLLFDHNLWKEKRRL